MSLVVLLGGGRLLDDHLEQRRASGVVMGVGSSATELVAQRGEPMDVSVEITNSSSHDVVFDGDPTLIAIPGIRNGRLVHTAFFETHDVAAGTEGWPPRELDSSVWGFSSDRFRIHPFDGYVLGPHKVAFLVYSIVGDGSLGTFAAGGVQVQYRLGSTAGSSRVFGGGVECVQLKPVRCTGPGTETSDEILTKLDALR